MKAGNLDVGGLLFSFVCFWVLFIYLFVEVFCCLFFFVCVFLFGFLLLLFLVFWVFFKLTIVLEGRAEHIAIIPFPRVQKFSEIALMLSVQVGRGKPQD